MKNDSTGIRQALRILKILAEEPRAFNQLRRLLDDMAAPSLSRLLRVMGEENWVEKCALGLYRPGKLFRCAGSILSSSVNYLDLIQPEVDELAEISGESSAYVEWERDGIIFLAKKEVAGSFHYLAIGAKNCSIFHNGFAILALAFQNAETIDGMLALHAANLPEPEDKLRQILKQAKDEKFIRWQDKGLRLGAGIMAGGKLRGVIGVSIADLKLSAEELARLAEVVRGKAARLSQLVGA